MVLLRRKWLDNLSMRKNISFCCVLSSLLIPCETVAWTSQVTKCDQFWTARNAAIAANSMERVFSDR